MYIYIIYIIRANRISVKYDTSIPRAKRERESDKNINVLQLM